MPLHAFPSGPFATNAYLIYCADTKQAAIVDPSPRSAETLKKFITTHHLQPVMILLTHSHWDHIADVSILKKEYNVPVLIHEKDTLNLEHPGSDGINSMVHIEGVKPTSYLTDGQHIKVGNLDIQVIWTPGHTPGGVCFYSSEEEFLLSGDTLFRGTIGNLSLPTAQPDLMWPTLKKLSQLPPQTQVFSGHGSKTSIGAESWLAHAEEHFR